MPGAVTNYFEPRILARADALVAKLRILRPRSGELRNLTRTELASANALPAAKRRAYMTALEAVRQRPARVSRASLLFEAALLGLDALEDEAKRLEGAVAKRAAPTLKGKKRSRPKRVIVATGVVLAAKA